MYTKTQKIKAIQAMLRKAVEDKLFDELDQEETALASSDEFLNLVTHKGLDMYLDHIEMWVSPRQELKRKDFI